MESRPPKKIDWVELSFQKKVLGKTAYQYINWLSRKSLQRPLEEDIITHQ